jgi:hypothetical protein
MHSIKKQHFLRVSVMFRSIDTFALCFWVERGGQ